MSRWKPKKDDADRGDHLKEWRSLREQRREHSNRTIRVRALLEEGLSEDEIVEITGWDPEDVASLAKDCLVEEMRRLGSTSPEEVFARYTMVCHGNIRRCDELYDKFQQAEQVSGLVGLIKTRQDIEDRWLKTGQAMGFVKKEPNKTFILTANMSNEDLRLFVADKLASMRDDMVAWGNDKSFEEIGEAMPSEARSLPSPREEIVDASEENVRRDLVKPTVGVVRRKVVARPAASTARGG